MKVTLSIVLDEEALVAFGRGIGEAIGEQLDAALLRLRTELQAANWSAWGRARGATEDNETGAAGPQAATSCRPQAVPQSAEQGGSPGVGGQVPAPPAPTLPPAGGMPAVPPAAGERTEPDGGGMAEAAPKGRPMRRKPELTEEAREKFRQNAAKARAAALAKREAARIDPAVAAAATRIAQTVARLAHAADPSAPVEADHGQVESWAAPRGLTFKEWSDLPAVNAKRVALGLPPFARRMPVR